MNNEVSTTQSSARTPATNLVTVHNQENGSTSQEPFQNYNNTVLSTYQQNHSFVLLSTAVINVKSTNNKLFPCRVSLDNGSQSNFVTRSFVNKLQLDTTNIDIPVIGINKIKTNISEPVNITICSKNTAFEKQISFLVLPSICDSIPFRSFNFDKLNVPSHLLLADPEFNKSAEIDMLLGCFMLRIAVRRSIKIWFKLSRPSRDFTRLDCGWVNSKSYFIIFQSQLSPNKLFFYFNLLLLLNLQYPRKKLNVKTILGKIRTGTILEDL